ncbi:MAG: sugar ABC transporter substrate-binding protein [Eubacteriales bacterium]
MKKVISLIVVLLMMVALMAGCTSQGTEAETTETADSSTSEEVAPVSYEWEQVGETENIAMVEQEPEEPLTFAFIGFQNNSFWDLVQGGVLAATDCLAEHNVTVDNINCGESITADVLNSAIETCVVQGYDGIVITPFVSGIENYLQDAIDAGIPVVTLYGESAATAEDTDRLCFIGQNNEAAGKIVGEAIAENTEVGKYAVITASFTMENLEVKRNAAQAVLDAQGYEFVGAYEANDSADETYSLTLDILTANPDIVAIYCVAGGPSGAPEAVKEMGMTGDVYVIGHDETDLNLQYVRTGEMTVIGQNPTGVSFDGFMLLYNNVVAGQVPEQEIMDSYSMILDSTNVNELFPE